ncbi:hypothetical protein Pcinc_042617 [Petrolisthes cinctipes]|uniref:Uncharacterized protein n=1 Tax=Petrolisthes cinctipes TaxID=88211 RepID=A0AAE1BKU5_PETCI|nr:hypothetical protein Pcinc_042617 [Petrolisthes cinctipes]
MKKLPLGHPGERRRGDIFGVLGVFSKGRPLLLPGSLGPRQERVVTLNGPFSFGVQSCRGHEDGGQDRPRGTRAWYEGTKEPGNRVIPSILVLHIKGTEETLAINQAGVDASWLTLHYSHKVSHTKVQMEQEQEVEEEKVEEVIVVVVEVQQREGRGREGAEGGGGRGGDRGPAGGGGGGPGGGYCSVVVEGQQRKGNVEGQQEEEEEIEGQ